MRHPAMRALGLAAVLLVISAPAASARAASKDDARSYWTQDRLEKAVPRDGVKGKPGGGGTSGSIGTGWTGPELVRKTTGKVFFTASGVNYVCSGSTVQDGNANVSVVLTAGHCTEDGADGGFVTNWVYVPDYERWSTKSCTSDPTRCFAASRLVTSSAWADSGDFDYDVAFAVVNGNTLESTWGSQAIGFNLSRGQAMYDFGYPAAGRYHGQQLIYCNGTVRQDLYSLDNAMTCSMTGGSSGGPWYINFNSSTGVGTANSLNSYKYSNDTTTMYGPYFGNYAQAVYNTAASGVGPNTTVGAPGTLP
jgi:V8-like Glu-specific endopeptidase